MAATYNIAIAISTILCNLARTFNIERTKVT